MSWQASTWALRGANVENATRKLIYMGFADHAHDDGTAAFPSLATVAEYAMCDVRTAKRHVGWLVRHGYLREGDQQLVSHYDPRRRPIVYDLPMSEARAQEWASEHATGSGRRSLAQAAGRRGGLAAAANRQVGRGDNLTPQPQTASTQVSWGDNLTPQDEPLRGDITGRPGVTPEPSRGDTGVTQTLQNPPEKPPPPPSAPAPPTEEEGDDLDVLAQELRDLRSARRLPVGRWTSRTVRTAIRRAVVDRGFEQRRVVDALRAVAVDPQTQAPGRVAENGPWWDATDRAARQAADVQRASGMGCEKCDRGWVVVVEPTRFGPKEKHARCPACFVAVPSSA